MAFSAHDDVLPFDLTGRVALVTGGSRGLGLAMARGLAAAGATLVLLARSDDELDRAAATFTGLGPPVHAVRCDVADREATAAAVVTATELAGAPDILLHDAGISAPQAVDDIDDETWDRTIAVDLTAAMTLTRAVVPAMRTKGWGRIVYVSSTFGEVSMARRGAYSAAKAGLRGLARAGAIELGPHGITVNCIAPGPFRTPMTEAAASQAQASHVFTDMTALGRWGEPSELAGAAVLLASDAGAYITGTTLFVDGGYTAR
ncbi:SDR family NAD(P)-dependent oxidoreductase [Cellulosimicrobium cellulans]|uniref:SDR family NAD(P)-dependent oxidoreductase n=1 Tax=Cellulosimicrobium cellulans TaxID=1710 RepID=UPI0008483E0A|nr:SDR family NAD(P)-dependent oxidoreductase [Cellulosimicrobium cellulans]